VALWDGRNLTIAACGGIILLLAGRVSEVTSPDTSAKQGARDG